MKGKVHEVTTAKSYTEVANMIEAWESDRKFLMLHAKTRHMDIEDEHHKLLKICPLEMRREILKDYDLEVYPTYLALKQDILDKVARELEDWRRRSPCS